MKEIVMPKLGLTMTEGTVAAWHKAEGDAVKEGEALFDVETDKLTNTIEASASGTLLKIYVPAGGSAKCLEKVAVIGAEGEAVPTRRAPWPPRPRRKSRPRPGADRRPRYRRRPRRLRRGHTPPPSSARASPSSRASR